MRGQRLSRYNSDCTLVSFFTQRAELASVPAYCGLLRTPQLLIRRLAVPRLFDEDQALDGDYGLEERRAGGTPGFGLVALPGVEDGEADFAFFIEVSASTLESFPDHRKNQCTHGLTRPLPLVQLWKWACGGVCGKVISRYQSITNAASS